jgi:hypothetical protein
MADVLPSRPTTSPQGSCTGTDEPSPQTNFSEGSVPTSHMERDGMLIPLNSQCRLLTTATSSFTSTARSSSPPRPASRSHSAATVGVALPESLRRKHLQWTPRRVDAPHRHALGLTLGAPLLLVAPP